MKGITYLGRYSRHHAKSRDIGETGKDLGDTGSVHAESLQDPRSSADGVYKPGCNGVGAYTLQNVESCRAIRLAEGKVSLALQVRVKTLK
jgi:hypothetical protein